MFKGAFILGVGFAAGYALALNQSDEVLGTLRDSRDALEKIVEELKKHETEKESVTYSTFGGTSGTKVETDNPDAA